MSRWNQQHPRSSRSSRTGYSPNHEPFSEPSSRADSSDIPYNREYDYDRLNWTFHVLELDERKENLRRKQIENDHLVGMNQEELLRSQDLTAHERNLQTQKEENCKKLAELKIKEIEHVQDYDAQMRQLAIKDKEQCLDHNKEQKRIDRVNAEQNGIKQRALLDKQMEVADAGIRMTNARRLAITSETMIKKKESASRIKTEGEKKKMLEWAREDQRKEAQARVNLMNVKSGALKCGTHAMLQQAKDQSLDKKHRREMQKQIMGEERQLLEKRAARTTYQSWKTSNVQHEEERKRLKQLEQDRLSLMAPLDDSTDPCNWLKDSLIDQSSLLQIGAGGNTDSVPIVELN